MEEKHRFISLAGTGRFTLTGLCADFHVSRKTGYKWLRRYQTEEVNPRANHSGARTWCQLARLVW